MKAVPLFRAGLLRSSMPRRRTVRTRLGCERLGWEISFWAITAKLYHSEGVALGNGCKHVDEALCRISNVLIPGEIK